LSAEADRGVSSPFVSAGLVWAVLQSVYAGNRSHGVTNTSLGAAINDVCHFLLSKVSPMSKSDSRRLGVFGMCVRSVVISVIFLSYSLLMYCSSNYFICSLALTASYLIAVIFSEIWDKL